MKRVLFVCVHNAGRSQMAAAFFNQLAAGRATAESAGTEPADHVHPEVVEAMREVGINLAAHRPKLLTPSMLDGAELVVSMGCGPEGVCPASWVPTEDWGLEDPKGQPMPKVREIRDEIQRRVAELIERLERQPG